MKIVILQGSPNSSLTRKHIKSALLAVAWNADDWTFDALQSHYQTLVRYLDFEDMGMVLGRGCGSTTMTSGSNRQDSKIIVVQDEEKEKKLSKLNASVTNVKTDPFYGARSVCIIVGPKDSGYEEEAFQLNPVKNAALVIGAMQSAAFAINVGSCWINCCKEMLDLPEGQKILEEMGLKEYQGVGCCILGYPNKTPGTKKIKEDRVLYY